MENKILIRYGELTLKGKNRNEFIKQLSQNIADFLDEKPETFFDRMFISYSKANLQKISKVLGISSFSPAIEIETDYEKILSTVKKLAALKKEQNSTIKTFALKTRRNWKQFPKTSSQIDIELGSIIGKKFNWNVNLKKPDLKIFIEVRKHHTYIFTEKFSSHEGYPANVGGKVLMMLSGGIDSPVASFELMKRGVHVDFISFVTPPLTDEKTVAKIKKIISHLKIFQGKARLFLLNFTSLMHTLEFISKTSYRITLMRRSFYRIAQSIALENNYLAIANGENIGQVASQTLESISCINNVAKITVFRPLLTWNKDDIVKLGKKIATYPISIEPAKESCELFAPKKPITLPKLTVCENLENEINELAQLELECLKKKQIFYF